MIKNGWLRFSNCLGFFLTAGLLATAYILQYSDGVQPCTLCSLQRMVLIVLSVLFLVGALFPFKKIGHFILSCLGLVSALIGIVFSGRQVWLQHFPVNGSGDCTISLQYLFKIFSFTDALKQIWHGGTECSEHGFKFLYLSMAEWSLIWFIVFFLIFLVQINRVFKRPIA